MMRIRGTVLSALVGLVSVVLPASKSEAGLFDWLRCKSYCSPCAPTCSIPSCPPVVQEGSYCDPCVPAPQCTVSYVRRCYMEPRTRMASQTTLEPMSTYVRRRYWDPCSRCYKTYYETATSYVKRRYCVPVTDYVQRSYLEPVTSCVTPSCPTPSGCPTPGGCPISPSDSSPLPMENSTTTSPGSASRRAPQVTSSPIRLLPSSRAYAPPPSSSYPRVRGNAAPVIPGA